MSGGGTVVDEFARQTGFDELSLHTDAETDELALAVGRWLSPKLYLQYITKLNSGSNQVKVRYDVNEKIQIQTETGEIHGADVFYKFER